MVRPSCQAGCREGYLCETDINACLPDCRTGWACADGFTCGADGHCTPGGGTLYTVGEPCAGGAQCQSGVCLSPADGWTGGTCAAICGTSLCGESTSCVALDGVAWCVSDCAGGCREGYVCSDDNACLPDCNQGWSCGEGFTCGVDGKCTPTPVVGAAVGAACGSAIDCSSGICFSAADGWSGGTCSDVCVSGACPEGSICAPLAGQPWCLAPCETTADCRDDYVCSDDLSVCLPDCNLGWDCGDSFICAANGQCEPSPASAIGLICGVFQDCGASGVECVEILPSMPGIPPPPGLCTIACDAANACPTGSECTSTPAGSYCLRSCDAATPCPQPTNCSPTLGVCGIMGFP